MNIFALHRDPKIAAQMHCDKHVVKMILETAQLLCVAHHVLNPEGDYSELYKKTHVNHPSAKWVRENSANYKWAYQLFVELLNEYTYRYGKIHKTSRLVSVLQNPPASINESAQTEFPQAMPDQYKTEDSIVAYRNYYNGAKASFAKWTKRKKPNWFIN